MYGTIDGHAAAECTRTVPYLQRSAQCLAVGSLGQHNCIWACVNKPPSECWRGAHASYVHDVQRTCHVLDGNIICERAGKGCLNNQQLNDSTETRLAPSCGMRTKAATAMTCSSINGGVLICNRFSAATRLGLHSLLWRGQSYESC